MVRRIHGLEIPQSLDDICHPEKMALIIYDMQLGILRQLKEGTDVL